MNKRACAALTALVIVLIGSAAVPAGAATSASSPTHCTKWGYGESEGGATCGEQKFKVRVWCTWGGSGISSTFRPYQNWAGCSRGVVHWDDPNAIEVIPEVIPPL